MPDGVGREFANAGHEVIYLREAIKTGSADDLVAVAANANDAILVACDGDMKSMVKKYGVSKSRTPDLSLIKITVKSKVHASPRVREAMTLIEHEWSYAQKKKARRLYIEIKDSVIRSMR
ncbi:DUF5615 family PIN-like protein [Octadecabacter sp. B2R22]|nr:DUF5615 family PIN-like protein [Octadecabacter sp. B2R22]